MFLVREAEREERETADLHRAVKDFLKNESDVNATYKYDRDSCWKETPLHLAVKICSAEAVKLLLDAGADPNKTGDTNIKPLHLACISPEEEALEVATLLVDYGADILAQHEEINSIHDGNSSIHHAFYSRNSKIVDMLLARLPKGANPTNCQNLSAFHIACAQGADHIVCDLLDSGVPIDHCTAYNPWLRNRMNGLKFAIMDNRRSTVELLLQRGATLSNEEVAGDMLLHLACECNFEKLIVDHCNGEYFKVKDLRVSRETHFSIINLLLDKGLDINGTDKKGLTPLLHMCTNRSTGKFAWRVPLKPQKNSKMREYIYVAMRRKQIFKYLLERGAAINALGPNGRSAIHLEAASDASGFLIFDSSIINLFLKHGADVNGRDERGYTPLHHILDKAENTDYGMIRSVEQLLTNGADLYARTPDGRTPFSMYVRYFRCCSEELAGFSVRPMLVHAQRLRMLGLKIIDRDMISWFKTVDLGKEKEKCEDELARMKREYVDGTSLYCLLKTGLNEARQTLDESQLQEIMTSMKIMEKYPHYARMFAAQVRKGPIQQQAESAMKLIARCEMPYLCTREIFRYLSDCDLASLAEIARTNSETSE